MASNRKFEGHPQSAPGDFYVVNDQCLFCGAPHVVAPDLIGWAEKTRYDHCIWKKQPETPAELDQAFAAFDASESDATGTREATLSSCNGWVRISAIKTGLQHHR